MDKPQVGIIGAGRLGTTVARLLSRAGYNVSIANSRGADSLDLQVKILLPGVTPKDVDNLIEAADVIILALPLRRYVYLPLSLMAGKTIIDAMNYWSPTDGMIKEFEGYAGSSSEVVSRSIPGTRLVKTLNSVAYGELEEHSLPRSTAGRRGIPLASDDAGAKEVAAELINVMGFDPVDLGPLKNGVLFQPDTPLFNARMTREEMLAHTSKV